MPRVYKNLGQSAPASGTQVALYTVPGATSAIASSLVACNQTALDQTIRVSHAVGGAADSPGQQLLYDVLVPANTTYVMTIGLTLAAADVIRVRASGSVSFNLYGQEVT